MIQNCMRTISLLGLFLMSSLTALADDITITEPWVREGPPTARVLGGFMMISNATNEDDALVSASSPDFKKIELHKTEMVDGIGKMIPQEQIVVPAGDQVVLRPGSYHLMLMMAQRPLKEGDTVKLEATFSSGRKLSIEMPVRKGSVGGMDHSHHMGH